MTKKMTYDKAYTQLQEILEELQGEAVGIDKLGDKMKKAKELLTYCKSRLREVEVELSDVVEPEE